MTSASELFHSRRSRVGRSVESELASTLDRNLHLHGNHRYHGDYHHQRRFRPEDDSDPLRRPRLHTQHLCHRVSQTLYRLKEKRTRNQSLSSASMFTITVLLWPILLLVLLVITNEDQVFVLVKQDCIDEGNGVRMNFHGLGERESIRMGLGPSEPGTGNIGNSETSSSRANNPRFTRNSRLPGAVLQARARLLERLRGLTANREINTASGFLPWHEFGMNDGLRLVDGETTVVWEGENPREALAPALYITNSVFQAEQSSYQMHISQKKPPGLSRAAFSSLRREVFHRGKVDGVAEECSICLERFWEGDILICLPCRHWFHPLCLDRWVRACGDCPYCRTAVVVNCGESNGKT